jgi:SAM-dependent methyltransferase
MQTVARDRLLRSALEVYRLDPGLALHRATEAALIAQVGLSPPLLEIGCHDGSFGGLLLDAAGARGARYGCDLDWRSLPAALPRYALVIGADAERLPWREATFGSVLCNSVLAHVVDLPACLAEVRRVLRPGGRLVATVPTPRFHEWLAPCRALRALGLNGRARALAARYDRRWGQRHVLDARAWAGQLAAAGLRVERRIEYLDARGSWAWSAWFTCWRWGVGRATVGALARRVLRPGAGPTRAVQRLLVRRLARHMTPVPCGGSALFVAVPA